MKKNKEIDLNIAIIDDSSFSRSTIIEILEDNGYTISGQGSSVEEGINILNASNSNIFLIDIVMPNASGLELAKLIRGSSLNPYLIMMSSINKESLLVESINHGAIDFLVKPFTKDQLIQSIEKVKDHINSDH